MDSTVDMSPPSPSSSDSDAYNTESARVYFGPLKTPERKFVAATQGLFLPPEPTTLRRSPRLSSPRPRSASPIDINITEEDMEEIDQVALLVHESDEESGDVVDSRAGTPQSTNYNLDEPSSALADKIIHAIDNPSPPPSPPSALHIFDPYHTTSPDITADYQSDLMFLRLNDGVERDDPNPLLVPSINPLPASTLLSNKDTELSTGENIIDQGDLISFDCLSTPTRERNSGVDVSDEIVLSPPQPPQPILSVDDLLSQSPGIQKLISPRPQHNTVPVIVEHLLQETPTNDFALSEGVSEGPRPEATVEKERTLLHSATSEQVLHATHSPNQSLLADNLVTPLRRSTRPRRSTTPIPIPETPSDPPTPIPPTSATRIKRKSISSKVDEVVSDSQDDEEGSRASTSRTIRVRHRSPGKAPFSFRRELGSLSPTSSNVLSTLNFTATEPSEGDDFSTNQPESSSSGLPMQSFSVFTPPVLHAPSTPVRSTGPVRFTSPSKSGASPNKYTLQTPAPGDPTNTPARRVPIVNQTAHSASLGFKLGNTPLPSVPTPARRVPPSEGPASLGMKSSTLRYGSPVKSREPSAEPSQRLGTSFKGKEKASQPTYQSSAALSKLPFPLVPATPASVEPSMSSAPATNPENLAKAISSPMKSSLKQPTSRIPRIGAKPYARAVDPKAAETAKTTTTSARKIDLSKPPPKMSTTETALVMRKNIRALGLGKSLASSSSSRVKPTASTSTTVLKRKREAEKPSPPKPRVIMLRQVPQVVIPPMVPASGPQSASAVESTGPKAKKPSAGPRQIRRVMDPEPSDTIIVRPPPRTRSPPAESERIANTSVSQQPIIESIIPNYTEGPSTQVDELTPGSPMKQDPPKAAQQQIADTEQQSAVEIPVINLPEAPEPDDSRLRRTTRSKRATLVRDLFTEGSSRPAPARRKPASFRSDDVFSGMSLVALKDLTVSNTVKNQKYLTARLETEVIRKEGLRPESPAVKVRTVVQRQQEERDRQRAERARRRSRRSDEMTGSSDIEAEDTGYSSQVDELMGDSEPDEPAKHRRGAGDEDDYETPERYNRHFKPTRLFGDPGDGQEEPPPKRRVKWDRGLFTTVYLDEVKLGSRQYLKENRDLKGILAPTAKALRLDTLGNLPGADSPLCDLIPENVTVKKIVYDDDAPPAPEVVAVKTRSKAKRK